MKEKLLEQRIKRPLNGNVRKNIEKRLKQLKKDISHLGQVVYSWNKNKDRLFVKTVNIRWIVDFSQDKNKKVVVWVDVPFFVIPFVKPYKEQMVIILKEEIKELIK